MRHSILHWNIRTAWVSWGKEEQVEFWEPSQGRGSLVRDRSAFRRQTFWPPPLRQALLKPFLKERDANNYLSHTEKSKCLFHLWGESVCLTRKEMQRMLGRFSYHDANLPCLRNSVPAYIFHLTHSLSFRSQLKRDHSIKIRLSLFSVLVFANATWLTLSLL